MMREKTPGQVNAGGSETEIKMKKRLLQILLVLGVLALSYQGIRQYDRYLQNRSCTREIFAMDTVMSFTAYGKDAEAAVEAAVQEVRRLDSLLSTGSVSGEVSKLNEAGAAAVSEDTGELFVRGMEIYEDTKGAFDFTVYPLMCLWGFPTKEYHVPTQEELREVLPLVDASKVKVEGNKVSLGKGQQVDFGGIAKGYASGRVMEVYREYGVTSGMVSLGGNVQVLGRKPDGSAWKIGIRNPEGALGEIVASLDAEDCAVVTSGGYERYFEEDGTTYIHILNPATGYPAAGELASVTVVSEDGTLADALSTSLYIMGMADAVSYWKAYGDEFEMVLITEAGEIYATEGIFGLIRTEREVEEITG